MKDSANDLIVRRASVEVDLHICLLARICEQMQMHVEELTSRKHGNAHIEGCSRPLEIYRVH